MTSIATLRQQLEAIKNSHRRQHAQHVTWLEDKTIIHTVDQDRLYIPNATGSAFHSDNTFVRVVMGPYGSGKSTLCLNEIVKRACAMPRWSSGRRRSRWGIFRNTSGELHSTTLQTWLAWFGDLGDISKRQKPYLSYEHMFNDGNGIVELELIFLALDREQDVGKIKSLELTGAYINELSEVPQGLLSHLKGRVNHRYPSRAFCDAPYWSGIIADTNPPDEDHWIYETFEKEKPEDYKMFKQPSGLVKDADGIWQPNIHCDNYENLSPDYYTKLAGGQTEEFIKVYCRGVYGVVGFGKNVYPEFNSDFHSFDTINYIQGETLYLGIDFGLTPACVVCQLSPRGQLLILKEYIAEDMGIRTFFEMIVAPGLKKDFPYCPKWIAYADPAGNSRSEIMEEMSCIGELNSLGLNTSAARTNDIAPRLGAVRFYLNKMVDGKPAFAISRQGCPVLYKGFVKNYVYKRLAISGEARYKDVPDKNMSSHPMDGLGYVCLELASDSIIKEKSSHSIVDMYNPIMRM